MIETETKPQLRLSTLGDGVAVLAAENVRGYDVHDQDNVLVGKVDDVVVDVDAGRVRALKVGDGGILGIGRRHWLIPVDVVKQVVGEYLFLETTKDRVTHGPAWRALDEGWYLTEVIRYYECQPFWSAGYSLPDWTRSD